MELSLGIQNVRILIFAVTLCAAIAPSTGSANKTSKLEVYSATETVTDDRSPKPIEAPIAAAKKSQAEGKALEEKLKPPILVQSRAVPSSGSFDSVPLEQAEPIIKRLKLVEDLIRRHGRAYDYRSLTVRELERILSQLEPRESVESDQSEELPPPPQASQD